MTASRFPSVLPGFIRLISLISGLIGLMAMAVTMALPCKAATDNRRAWNLLLDNKPLEAREAFRENAADKDPHAAGEACRGAGIIARFMGDNSQEMQWTLDGFLKDKDTLALMAGQIRHLNYGDHWKAYEIKQALEVGNGIIKHPSQLTAPILFEMARRNLNDGDLSKAGKIQDGTGLIRQWWAVGPFSNISGSGFDQAYPPEASVELGRNYDGKNGDKVRWFPLTLPSPATWVMEWNHIPSANAILYFASQVESPVERKALLSFGASGSFKVFLNDKLVLAERVYRNTGADAFVQEVTLRKGPNRVLVKLGNEERYSNFLLRFMDADGRGMTDLKAVKPEGAYPKEPGTVANLKNMPSFDREMAYLRARLDKDPDDEDAALLAMDLFNVHEMTDSGEVWALRRLDRHPQSALWEFLLSESLLRSRQVTRSQAFSKAAYRNSPYCATGWTMELNRLTASAGAEAVLEFLARSPEEFRNSKRAIMSSMAQLGKLGRRDEALKAFARIESGTEFDEEIATLEAAVYKNQGRKKEAVAVWKKFLEHGHLHPLAYQSLADLHLKSGDWSEAADVLREGLRYLPDNINLWLGLANIYLHQKKYPDAEKYVAGGLAQAPYSPVLLGLKGTLDGLQGDKAGAQAVLRQSVESNYNDFPSWDKLLQIEGRPSFESLAPLPNIDSLVKSAQGWEGLKREHGSILAYIEDVFFYPSRAVRHRGFLAVHLPTQDAVNNWKEYSVSYNPSYQTLGITRAFSRKAAGSEVDAEVGNHGIVFKSLEPGDCIVVEWTLKDQYDGEMARQAWGQYDFKLGMPVFDSRLRLYMAGPDTIGYAIRGPHVKLQSEDRMGLKLRLFSRGPYTVPVTERFLPVNDTTYPDVIYSTFADWGRITDWYANLVENKTAPAPILRKVADSLFAGTRTDAEKVAKVQLYVTANVAYSSLSFRQSGWIPQTAQEVMASRLGDCKDMAAMAKSLLDLAGMETHLVLVATRDQFGTRPGPVGPHFNHCILAYNLGGKERYMDLTDPDQYWTRLPKGDQGAVALVIRRGNRELMHLPMDKSSDRSVQRKLTTVLNDSGVATIGARTLRTGIFARGQRSGFRFLSPEERKQEMLHGLSDDYADVALDSLWFGNLEPTSDSVEYGYNFRGRQAVKTSGPTHIFTLYLPDRISNFDIPDGEPKPAGLDLVSSWFTLGSYNTTGTVVFPAHWKLLNKPAPLKLKTPYGEYSFTFALKGNVLSYSRKALLEMGEVIPGREVDKARGFLNQIAKNDDVQLVFTDNGK